MLSFKKKIPRWVGLTSATALTLTLSFSAFALDAESFRIDLGEKLFLEERFSYSFYLGSQGSVNLPTSRSDRALQWGRAFLNENGESRLGSHYRCSTCHLVDQMSPETSLVLTYSDPFRKSPQPYRFETLTTTTRNSMNLVGSKLKHNQPLHWDGEYFSAQELTCDGLTGANLGWQLQEWGIAVSHISRVIKKDDGSYSHPSDIKESYAQSFKKLGWDVHSQTDQVILGQVCQLISAYMKDIDFSRGEDGQYNGSAYDEFLRKNQLPVRPASGQTDLEYSKDLQTLVSQKTDWKWVEPTPLSYHSTNKRFGWEELEGMKIFMGRANCIQCHRAPLFTDSGFHNVGISQLGYDRIHGAGSFAQLKIPDQKERLQQADQSLTATRSAPLRKGVFRQAPLKDKPHFVDLGVWNMIYHPEKKHLLTPLKDNICKSLTATASDCGQWSPSQWLEKSVALFKTPSLRSLGQSPPYFHNGSVDHLVDVLRTYVGASRGSRRGLIINADPELKKVHLSPAHIKNLESFLNALNEDYD